MKRKKRILGVFMIIAALIIMQLPVSEAEAASSSASDFKMEGSTLVKYRGTETNVSIPDTVEVIGRSAFEDNKTIELVVVPNSVKRIDPYAFWGCENLDTVVLGKGLSDVGDFAFTGCTGLKQMSIPANVTSIGIQAFADCVNLTDISIPPETVYIHETAFDGCYRLTIHCETGTVADKYAQEFYERQKEMPEYEDVPNYDDSSVSTVPTPEPKPTVTPAEGEVLGTTHVVGNSAVIFVHQEDFTVLDGASQSQQSQDELPIGNLMSDWWEGVAKYTIVDGTIVADQAYYRSTELGSITLPDGIKEIGQFSFARSTVSDIVLPYGVESIDYGAFYHCDSLQNVALPDTVMCVEPKAFEYTAWVNDFLSGEGDNAEGDFLIEGGVLVAYRGNAEDVIIPEGVRVIAGEAFQGHTEIKSLSLPDSLLVVGEGAFEGCNSLRAIDFGNNIEEIKDRAFQGVSSLLGGVSLPASLKKLGLQAFGSVSVVYEGTEPEHTYETSASRLSNESYREYNAVNGLQPGVRVFGLEGASASLEGADRSYDLIIESAEDISEMERACMRSFKTSVPADMVIYDMTLSDASGIPLTKLGSQALTVVLPVPDTLRGQNLKLLTLDRNGQPEMLAVERVSADGVEFLRFQTNHLSLFGIYGAGPAGDEELSEANVEISSLSAGPNEPMSGVNGAYLLFAKFLVGGCLLVTGLVCILVNGKKRGI